MITSNLEDANTALRELERLGLVEKSGELRKGQPVWVATAYGKHLEETAPDLLELILHHGQLSS